MLTTYSEHSKREKRDVKNRKHLFPSTVLLEMLNNEQQVDRLEGGSVRLAFMGVGKRTRKAGVNQETQHVTLHKGHPSYPSFTM